MSLRFTVLASGSSGNATLVEANDFGVLIDAGLGPRQLAQRLKAVGRSWADIQAVLLTHTHSDHWRDRTLALLHRHQISFYCHADHQRGLSLYSTAYASLQTAGLVRVFNALEEISLSSELRCRPLPISHDGGETFGFRLDGAPNLFGHTASIGYVADLGTWNTTLAEQLADVDLLAVEFNHDVALEHCSGRSPLLIARVLGDRGHLSNDQGAELVQAVVQRSQIGRLRHVVQLHLSRDCNRPTLAREAARAMLARLQSAATLYTALQHEPLPTVTLSEGGGRRATRNVRRAGRRQASLQPWLPGFECDDAIV